MPLDQAVEGITSDWLDNHLETVRLPAWKRLFWEGDSPGHFYIIRSGLIGVYRSVSTSKKILIQLIRGDQSVGLYEMMSHTNHQTHAVPIKEAVAYRGTRQELETMGEKHPRWLTQLLLHENDIQSEMYEKIDEVISYELETRLARVLILLANHTGRRSSDGIEITVKLTRKQLSQMLGCASESVIRILSLWEKDGWITTNNRLIVLEDIKQLIKLSKKEPSSISTERGLPLIA